MAAVWPRGAGAHTSVILQAVALVLLLWPTASLAIDRLSHRQSAGWMAPLLYLGTLLTFMAVNFGKPFDVAPWLQALPVVQIVALMGWIAREALPGLRFDRPAGGRGTQALPA